MNSNILSQIQPSDTLLAIWSSTEQASDTSMEAMMASLKSVLPASAIQLENLEIFNDRQLMNSDKVSFILTGWPVAFKSGWHSFELFSRLVSQLSPGGRVISREAVVGDLAQAVETIQKNAVLAGLTTIKFVSFLFSENDSSAYS